MSLRQGAWRSSLTPALTRDDGGRQAAGSRRVERLVSRHSLCHKVGELLLQTPEP